MKSSFYDDGGLNSATGVVSNGGPNPEPIFDILRTAITEMMSEENMLNLLDNLKKFNADALMTLDGLRVYSMHFTMHVDSYIKLTELSSKLSTYLILENIHGNVINSLVQVFKKPDENLSINVYGENIPAKFNETELKDLLLNNKELMTLLIVLLTIVI